MSKVQAIDRHPLHPEQTLLVGVGTTRDNRWEIVHSLEELFNLTKTAGGNVVEHVIQIRPRLDPATLIGAGKVQEIARICQEYGIELLIFDRELSAAQIRNIEKTTHVRTIDRTMLILDIFAKHARTKEAKLQVELAQLEYRFSRLVGIGLEYSRLGGGIGTRGPGEKKLEIDRRRIQQRITSLKSAIKKIEKSKQVQRKGRKAIPKVAVVGYTNAGKSSLVNALTRSKLMISDQLFSTLDSNTSLLFIKPHYKVLMSDTVGFLKNLPHDLIASFHATLAEVREADMLIHIVDATSEDLDDKIGTVNRVLIEIETNNIPRLLVLNKIDRLVTEEKERLTERYPDSHLVSAQESRGLDALKDHLRRLFFPS
ncbi:GTPase HflX [candidate division WOR-3 bacterium]|nr:GTPase HflX [candidate division WOR-3 bacterium]